MPNMESPSEAAAAMDSFSQVIFYDIPHSYPPATPVTCRYTLTAAYQPNTRDWLGIFKVGWSRARDYHTFQWVDPCLDVVGKQLVTKQVIFTEYYLPKDDMEFYQFCYIGSDGQVRGASTPFCFKHPVEQNTESCFDGDLLVITTQEQVEQSAREKTELMEELDQKKEENKNLQSSLEMQEDKLNNLKRQNEQRGQENSELMKEMDQIKKQNESLRNTLKEKQQETDNIKEILTQTTKQLEIQQLNNAEQEKRSESRNLSEALKQKEEKYSQAVVKINQLKEEREKLRGRADIDCREIVALNQKVKKGEEELLKLRDHIQLLQVDLQSSEKEKERFSLELLRMHSLSHDMEKLKRENQELRRRLSEQETLQNIPDDNLKMQRQTLLNQLQDAQALLANGREESKNNKWRAEHMEREMLQCKDQLGRLVGTSEQLKQKSNKLELQLTEAHGTIAEKDGMIEERDSMIMIERHEKVELTEENMSLQRDIEGLRREFADLLAAPAESVSMLTDSHHGSPAGNTSTSPAWQQDTRPDSQESLYEIIGDTSQTEEEQALVCRHCQESFPGITRDELKQHEQCHIICPFCTLICDSFEQAVFEDHVYSHEL